MRITPENLNKFVDGTRVRFNYGAMYGYEDGVVIGRDVNEWGARLIAKTDAGVIKYISSFTTVGIGVYLIDEMNDN